MPWNQYYYEGITVFRVQASIPPVRLKVVSIPNPSNN